MRLFSSAACSATGLPTCAILISVFGSRPPFAASQRAAVSWVPPMAATPMVAPFRAAMRFCERIAWLDAGFLQQRWRDHHLQGYFRHQVVDDFKRLALGDGAERGFSADRGEVDVAGVQRGKCSRIAAGRHDHGAGEAFGREAIQRAGPPQRQEAQRGKALGDPHALLGRCQCRQQGQSGCKRRRSVRQ